jgi:hypothetical protein
VERQNCAKQDTDTPHERAVEAIPELRFGFIGAFPRRSHPTGDVPSDQK